MQGTILASRYRVLEYIAKGGFGKTYLAEDTQLPGKDKCVVKQLYPSVDNPNFIKVARRLFRTEAQTLNIVGSHDQIPRLMAYFEEDEKFYLVQQYIQGHTLSKELSDEPWSEERVIELLKDCLNILDFIHAKGVIHRDVKPDNLIRRQSDRKLVLVDFGTVKEVIAEQTQLIPATVAVGTRGYMPTEQALGKPRITSDIYALGIIGIQALTAVHPTELEENDNGEIIWQDLASCSDRLKAIVAQMTRYHFKERYQSATEAIAALDKLDSKFQEAAAAQTEVAQYTPTVRFGTAQLANMSEPPPASTVQPQSVVRSSSITTPNNPTSFAAKSPELLRTNVLQSKTLERSHLLENESSSMTNTQKPSKTLITLGVAVALGTIASGGMYLLNQQSTKSAQNSIAEQVASFNTMLENQNYQDCYQQAVEMNAQAADEVQMPKEQQQEFEAKCGLATAQQDADDLKYGEALEIAKTLPKNTSIDAEIQQQIDSWSEQLLAKANKVYEQTGNLEEAIETVKQIPQDSSVRSQVIDAKNAWKAESSNNQAIIASAEKALSEENWQYAKQQAIKVRDSSPTMYWQQQAKAIISQAESGIAESAPPEVATPTPPSNPVPTPTKDTKPSPEPDTTPTVTSEPKAVTPNPEPKAVTPNPEPKPTPRIDQNSSEPLRDLGGNGESLPGNPANTAPQNDAPLRDL